MVKRTLFFANSAHLSYSNNQLHIKNESGETTRAVEDIGYLVLEHPNITITQFAIQSLAENNTAVIFCGGNYMPNSMLLPLSGHQLQNERFRHQVNASEPLKKNLWKQTIQAKIRNQADHLLLQNSHVNLHTFSTKVKSGDPSNVEAIVAKRYWNSLIGNAFRRERFGEKPNHFLNYGYAILRAATARALTGSGLLPTLGIHHHNKYNAFCLADDIMEPYRPMIDREVIALLSEGYHDSELIPEVKQRLIAILHADCLIGKKKRPLMIALSETTASLAGCYAAESKKIKYATLM